MSDAPDLATLCVGDVFRCEDEDFRNVCVVTHVDGDVVAGMVVNGAYPVVFGIEDGTMREGDHLEEGRFEVTFVGDLPPDMASSVRDILPRLESDGFRAYGVPEKALIASVLAAMDGLPGSVPLRSRSPRP